MLGVSILMDQAREGSGGKRQVTQREAAGDRWHSGGQQVGDTAGGSRGQVAQWG